MNKGKKQKFTDCIVYTMYMYSDFMAKGVMLEKKCMRGRSLNAGDVRLILVNERVTDHMKFTNITLTLK